MLDEKKIRKKAAGKDQSFLSLKWRSAKTHLGHALINLIDPHLAQLCVSCKSKVVMRANFGIFFNYGRIAKFFSVVSEHNSCLLRNKKMILASNVVTNRVSFLIIIRLSPSIENESSGSGSIPSLISAVSSAMFGRKP